ncbi:MAG: flagellar protein FlgN [Verrucomicrobiales bacterium]|nr:flagellar protein FlgN [Verrucomicrobiales bacterium]
MTDFLQPLIDALREELQQYGEMLALLDREQELVMQRAGTDLFESVSAIQSQAIVIQQARTTREQCRAAVAQSLGYAADCPFAQLIPVLPADYQPLVGALVRENNQLLVRVQQRARQNHLLLSRSLELMQRFLSTLFPSRDAQVYDVQGQRPAWTPPMHAVYEAVG